MSAKYHAFHAIQVHLSIPRLTRDRFSSYTWHNFTRCVYELLISVTQIYCSLRQRSLFSFCLFYFRIFSIIRRIVNCLLKMITKSDTSRFFLSLIILLTIRNHIRFDMSPDITGNHATSFSFSLTDQARTVHTLVDKKKFKR